MQRRISNGYLNIGVNDGHTIRGFGTGAVGKIKEGEHTRLVGAEVRRLLKEAGHNAINCTIDSASSVNQSLSLIMDQANRQDLDWFLSIHFNAGGGLGVEAYTYASRQYQDAVDVYKNIAKAIVEAIIGPLQITHTIEPKIVEAPTVGTVTADAGTGFKVIGQLKKGDTVKIAKKIGEHWYSIYFGYHGGYVSTDFIK